MDDKKFSEQLYKIETRLQIQEVHNKYAHGINQANERVFMGIWDENAFWDMGHMGTVRGLEEINALWKQITSLSPRPNQMICNTIVEFKERGIVEAVSNNFAISARDGNGKATYCMYYDRFIEKENRWLLTSRIFKPIFTTSISDLEFVDN